MATLSKLKPGQILYDKHKCKAGNTTLKRWGVWPVEVIEVHKNHIIASWNGNKSRKFYEAEIKKFLVKKPTVSNDLIY